MQPNTVIGLLPLLTACLLAGHTTGGALACDCGSKDSAPPPANSLAPRTDQRPRGSATTSTLDDVLTPELVQSYLALQLHRAAMDMAEKAQARSPTTRCSQGVPCYVGGGSLRRSKRFATGSRRGDADVPVVAGLAGLPLPTPSSPLLRLSPKATSDNDVPVFKGNHEGTPLVRVVVPPPSPRPTAAARSALGTTVPDVPVVRGAPDPAHPTSAPTRASLLPGDLQLTREEEEALAVLLEGRHHKASTARPSARPTEVSAVSGKVGGKAGPLVPRTQPGRGGAGSQLHRKSGDVGNGGGGGGRGGNCCTQTRLLQELERQLAVLRRMNADHLHEEWVRASYPSPYYPYLHNLPVHPARGYDGAPALLPAYFLPSSGWQRRRGPGPAPAALDHRSAPGPDCKDGEAEDGGELDDKVGFSEQQREVDDLRGDDPHDDVGVDHKIGEPVDFEIR
ncbi:hypothetical protein ONE63_007953 [Megalurothrips usitatus]|uniref:Uncharacterized protein n=1 Tax=Megalurothrips usitatus TaxID=439358 RepID=A0AAV7XTE3_9NEOP|nr:hypothetical protein ONE63_007953 [Megalurothrips usitatus]